MAEITYRTRDIYAPEAYSSEYNKLLLDQIIRPIKERETAGQQALKEAFVAGGGYTPGAYLSGMRKLRKDIGEQITGASTQVGLTSAEAKFQEALTRDKWEWEAGEAEKLRKLQKYMQERGFEQTKILEELRYQYQKDLLKYQARLQQQYLDANEPNFLQGLTTELIGAGTQWGLQKLFPVKSSVEKYLEKMYAQ